MIKRTLTTFDVTAVKLDYKNGQAVAEPLGTIQMTCTKVNTTNARKAFKAAGIDVPRGCKIEAVPVESIVYGVTVEQFMQMAKPIETVKTSTEE